MSRLGRIVAILVVAALAAVVAATVETVGRWFADRAPRRDLNGSRPLVGSLDTWPDVPRAPGTTSRST